MLNIKPSPVGKALVCANKKRATIGRLLKPPSAREVDFCEAKRRKE